MRETSPTKRAPRRRGESETRRNARSEENSAARFHQESRAKQRRSRAKRALKPAIMGLDEKTFYTVIVFSDKVTNRKDEVVAATDSTKTVGYEYLSQPSSEGGTNALSAIKKCPP